MNFKVIVRDLRMWWRSYGLQVCAVLAWFLAVALLWYFTFPEGNWVLWIAPVFVSSGIWVFAIVPKLPASLKNLRRRKPGKSSRQRTMAH
ncbi:MAG: hypothetical protein KBB55_00995 [Candidatus Buchananbacteria bacterium]|nr:hypothetical protein [Candidatus Buchananbacteria bacterium]